MSIRIALDNPPEFYTNLDAIRGHVQISLTRNEHIGAIIVKLEGESKTALGMPPDGSAEGISQRDLGPNGDILTENHKILYKVAQVFPDETKPPLPSPIVLAPGTHRFPFQFKFPFNNACGDPAAMARIGGLANPNGSVSGLFGLGGIRVMDGTKQLMYTHVKKTLPPSFTGFPGEAEIRYYVKVTIQRPGMFRENWRYHIGLKFLPIEPPRPPRTNQEAYARRPFTFRPRSRDPSPRPEVKKRPSLFNWTGGHSSRQSTGAQSPTITAPTANGKLDVQPSPGSVSPDIGPEIEMSARIPHPAILTCNKPIPLRLLAKKLAAVDAEIFLIALQVDLIGETVVRCQDLIHTEASRWVILNSHGLSIPVSRPGDAVGTEIVVPDTLWKNFSLPNTIMPSFVTCNLSRTYQLEIRLGLSWGKKSPANAKGKTPLTHVPQEIYLPLNFSSVEVYSGLAPSPELLEAMRRGRMQRRQSTQPERPPPSAAVPPQQQIPRPVSVAVPVSSPHPHHTPTSPIAGAPPPVLPPRTNTNAAPPRRQQQPPSDIYPPQLRPGQTAAQGQAAPPYDDAPPSYDEAMAEMMSGPVVPSGERPAYSGVTNENEPSSWPGEKNSR
ncbi:hypothetical protein QBC39DRAFT_38624 [Podospora conica]|nr:hypothetical protein QBC39DRAFT_38624 [Schizothecium conicum]